MFCVNTGKRRFSVNTKVILPESLRVGNMPMCGKFSVVWCKSAFNTVQMKNCTYTVPKSFGSASFWGANVSREKVSRRKFNKNRKTCSLAIPFAQEWQKFCGKFRRKQVKLNICCCWQQNQRGKLWKQQNGLHWR